MFLILENDGRCFGGPRDLSYEYSTRLDQYWGVLLTLKGLGLQYGFYTEDAKG